MDKLIKAVEQRNKALTELEQLLVLLVLGTTKLKGGKQMSYRPPNWPQMRTAWSDEHLGKVPTPTQCLEAGADLIIEALKEKGALMTPEQMELIAPDRQYPFGHLVFIPVEEASK